MGSPRRLHTAATVIKERVNTDNFFLAGSGIGGFPYSVIDEIRCGLFAVNFIFYGTEWKRSTGENKNVCFIYTKKGFAALAANPFQFWEWFTVKSGAQRINGT